MNRDDTSAPRGALDQAMRNWTACMRLCAMPLSTLPSRRCKTTPARPRGRYSAGSFKRSVSLPI